MTLLSTAKEANFGGSAIIAPPQSPLTCLAQKFLL